MFLSSSPLLSKYFCPHPFACSGLPWMSNPASESPGYFQMSNFHFAPNVDFRLYFQPFPALFLSFLSREKLPPWEIIFLIPVLQLRREDHQVSLGRTAADPKSEISNMKFAAMPTNQAAESQRRSSVRSSRSPGSQWSQWSHPSHNAFLALTANRSPIPSGKTTVKSESNPGKARRKTCGKTKKPRKPASSNLVKPKFFEVPSYSIPGRCLLLVPRNSFGPTCKMSSPAKPEANQPRTCEQPPENLRPAGSKPPASLAANLKPQQANLSKPKKAQKLWIAKNNLQLSTCNLKDSPPASPSLPLTESKTHSYVIK